MNQDFINYLKEKNLAKNTVSSYLYAVNFFNYKYKDINKNNLLSYKGYLVENYSPRTVNIRIQAINNYLDFLNKKNLKLSSIRIQQKPFLENVISDSDYEYLKKSLKKDKSYKWYFVVRFLGATGARVSELLNIKIEHVKSGYIDMYCKGGKVRRIYIPIKLQKETIAWINNTKRESGFLFINRLGQKITSRGISLGLKKIALSYGINPEVVYPHSFRHRFAKNFINKYNDISLLADLMGHDSIETTRIYLRKTSTEQRKIVDKIITW